MIRSILAGAVFAAIVLVPCVIAMLSKAAQQDSLAEADVLEEGFI
jgi:hypothetical protein